jgi:hypothetical protein
MEDPSGRFRDAVMTKRRKSMTLAEHDALLKREGR